MIDLSAITHCPFCHTKLIDRKENTEKYCSKTYQTRFYGRESHFSLQKEVDTSCFINVRTSEDDDPSFHWEITNNNFHYYTPDGESKDSNKTFSSLEEFAEHVLVLSESFLFMLAIYNE